MKKSTFIIIVIVILAIIGAGMFYFFYLNTPAVEIVNNTDTNIFSPFARNTVNTNTSGTTRATSTINTNIINNVPIKLPKLRQLSETPVAGMSASTTKIKINGLASTTKEATIVRFVDRGTGHISEANDINNVISKISNTTLPRIYESYWNKNLNAVILRYLRENSDIITNFYAEIRLVASSTALSNTPYEIKGKYLSPNIDQITVSPLGDKVFSWNIESDNGIGYISSFDEKSKTKIVDTPMTQVNIDWPESSIVTITTKGSASSYGYMYGINTKTAIMNKVFGGIRGLSAKMSKDAKKVIYSIGGNGISMGLFDIKNNNSSEIILRTLADKCIWSTLRKNEVYCAVPTEIPDNSYPDAWYKGTVSFVDQIWHLDTDTGEVHLLANLLTLSNKLIDATQLTLDPKENFLYFINKRDLTLWSLDLNE